MQRLRALQGTEEEVKEVPEGRAPGTEAKPKVAVITAAGEISCDRQQPTWQDLGHLAPLHVGARHAGCIHEQLHMCKLCTHACCQPMTCSACCSLSADHRYRRTQMLQHTAQ